MRLREISEIRLDERGKMKDESCGVDNYRKYLFLPLAFSLAYKQGIRIINPLYTALVFLR